MTTYRELAAQLIADGEGLVLVVYDDATGKPLKQGDTIKGHPTIGYGRNLAAKGIDESEAQALLAVDLIDAEDIAKGFVGATVWQAMRDVRRAVLMDMAHNLGADGLYRFAKLRGAIERGDYERAAAEIEDSTYFRQVGRRGPRNRDAMRTGKWGGAAVAVQTPSAPKPAITGTGPYVLARKKGAAPVYWTGSVAVGNSNMHSPCVTDLIDDARRFPTAAEADRMALLWEGLSQFAALPVSGKTLEAWGE